MLAEAQAYMRRHNSPAKLYVYGQDYNKRAFATAASDMLMKQVDHNGHGENIQFGDTFTDDKFAGESSTTSSPIRLLAWIGRSSRRKSWRARGRGEDGRSRPGCRASTMGRCCSSST